MPASRIRRLLAALAVAVVAAASTPVAVASSATGDRGSFRYYSYANAAGARKYMVYTPPHARAGMPLVVDLHGCTETAPVEAKRSRWNDVAARLGLIVVYPEQDPNANGSRCWNWFLPDHQNRGGGEASIIAGITSAVVERWHADSGRVYVFGISAGGAMTTIMAAAYPDLYAAAGVYAGCEYKGFPCLASAPAQPYFVSGQWAHEAGGRHARVVPVFVVNGDLDELVPVENAFLVVQSSLVADDLAWHGSSDDMWKPWTRTESGRKPTPTGQRYDVYHWDAPNRCELAQLWIVHGMLHQWSNADADGSVLTDPDGPDVTTPAARFFLAHPKPPKGVGCRQLRR